MDIAEAKNYHFHSLRNLASLALPAPWEDAAPYDCIEAFRKEATPEKIIAMIDALAALRDEVATHRPTDRDIAGECQAATDAQCSQALKYPSFLGALKQLCVEHGVMLSTSGHDILQVWDLGEGDNPIYLDNIEDRTKPKEHTP